METELKTIVDIVCDFYKISPELVLSKNRKREITDTRQICHYFGRLINKEGGLIKDENDKPKFTLEDVAWNIGGFDHATTLYSKRVVQNRIDSYKDFKTDIEYLDLHINYMLSGDTITTIKDGYTEIIHKSKGFLR